MIVRGMEIAANNSFAFSALFAVKIEPMKQSVPTLGVIYGNRDFFPDQLVTEARADIAKLFAKFGIKAIQLGETDSKLGGVETHDDARKCAELFRKHAG